MAEALIVGLITAGSAYLEGASLLAAIVIGGLAALTYELSSSVPSTKKLKPASLADFSITQANEGQPIPVIYGRVKLLGNIIWYGNLETEEVTKSIHYTSLFVFHHTKKVLTGYKYYIDMWQALCMGKAVIEEIYLSDDKSKQISCSFYVWSDGTQDIWDEQIQVPISTTYSYTSSLSQLISLPYYPKLYGVTHIFFKRFLCGENVTSIPAVYYTVRRVLETGLPNEDVYDSDGNYLGNNPAAIIYDLLVNFAQINPIDINWDSFVDAANYFNSEQIGLNYVFSSTQKIQDVIEQICKLTETILDYDESGKIILRILKNTDTAVTTIEDNFSEFNLSREGWATLTNTFRANFVEDGVVRTIVLENPAALQYSRERITQDYDLTAISNRNLAYKLLTKIMKKLSYPKSTLQVKVPLKYAFLSIGDVVTIINNKIGLNGDFRVVEIEEPKPGDTELSLSLIQHSEKIFDSYYISSGESLNSGISITLDPFKYVYLYELDYNNYTKDALAYVLFVPKQAGYITGYAVYTSLDGENYELFTTSRGFGTVGTLTKDYPITKDIDDEIGIYYTPAVDYLIAYPNIPRDDLFKTNRVAVLVPPTYDKEELIAFQNFEIVDNSQPTEVHLSGIVRGLNWTQEQSWNTGDLIFITYVTDDNILFIPYTTPFYVKVVPMYGNISGSLEDAQAIYVEPKFKAKKPLPPYKVSAKRISGEDVEITVFAKSKTLSSGSGIFGAEVSLDTYPFEYEGTLIVDVLDAATNQEIEEFTTDKTVFTISNPSALRVQVKTRWNNFISDSYAETFVPAGSSFFNPQDWAYYRPISILWNDPNATSTALIEFQVPIELTSTNFDFTKAASDGSDLRFTLSDQTTTLSYWIETWDSVNQYAKIWVKVPSIPLNDSTFNILMWYGYSLGTIASASSGTDTFDFFDDFETWSGWINYKYGVVSQSSDYAYNGTYSLKKSSYGDPSGGFKSLPFSINYPFILEAFINRTYLSGANADRIGIIDTSGNGYGFGIGQGYDFYIDKRTSYTATYLGRIFPNVSITNQWYLAQLVWNNGNLYAAALTPDGKTIYTSTSATDTSYTSFDAVYVFGGYTYYVDVIKIRKYTEVFPTITVGAEVTT